MARRSDTDQTRRAPRPERVAAHLVGLSAESRAAAYLVAKGYRIVDHAWILEYARGPIVTMLPFGLADAMFSTLDGRTICRTFWLYGKHVLRNWRTAAGRRARGPSARPGALLE